MSDQAQSGPWYHGSPETLTVLRAESWVTPYRELAKAFSHRPARVSMGDDRSDVKHDGRVPGFLYQLIDPVEEGDVEELSGTDSTHWQTRREMAVRLLESLVIDDPPRLTDEEIDLLRGSMPDGAMGFISTGNEG